MILLIVLVGWAIYGGRIPSTRKIELKGKQSRIFGIVSLGLYFMSMFLVRTLVPVSMEEDNKALLIFDYALPVVLLYVVGIACSRVRLKEEGTI